MKKHYLLILSVVLIGLFLAACTAVPAAEETFVYEDDWDVVVVQAGDPIKIGFAAALTGAGVDVLGIDEKRGVEIALRDRPEIMGFEVELDIQDALCSAEGGQTVANKFVSDPQIVAIVGHMCSSSCEPAANTYEQHGYVMASPSCTAPSLTDPETATDIFHRVAFDDTKQGANDAQFIYETLGLSKIATIHDGSPYGDQLAAQVTMAFEELGGTVIAAEAINVGDTDMKPVLSSIKNAEGGPPELIFFGGFVAEGAQLASQRIDVGMEDVLFMGADGILAKAFVETAGDAADGVYASGPPPVSDEFIATYVEGYGETPIAPYHGSAYDAYNMIANAIEAVAEEDGAGNLHIGRKALRDALRGTTGYGGLTGIITCNEYGNCGPKDINVFAVQDGEYVVVAEFLGE